MINPELLSLEDVTLLHNREAFTTGDVPYEFPDGTPMRRAVEEYTKTQRRTSEFASSLGATVLGISDEGAPPIEDGVYWQCRLYNSSYHTVQTFLGEHAADIDLIPRLAISDIPNDALEGIGTI